MVCARQIKARAVRTHNPIRVVGPDINPDRALNAARWLPDNLYLIAAKPLFKPQDTFQPKADDLGAIRRHRCERAHA